MTATKETRERPRGLVLVVDDYADTRDLYEQVLGAAGYSVISAESFEQALVIASAIAFDLVIIDVGPGMNGFELAQRLHAQGRRRPRLLAVAGHSPESISTETVLFDAYLIKPWPPEKLIAAATDLLAKRG